MESIETLPFLESGKNCLHDGSKICYVACPWMKLFQGIEEEKKVVIKKYCASDFGIVLPIYSHLGR